MHTPSRRRSSRNWSKKTASQRKRNDRITDMLLEGKTGLVMGVANKRSIAWGIANAVNKAGARLILTYQSERLGENVRELAPSLNNPLLLQCNVANDDEIQTTMSRIREEVGHLD